MLKKLNNLAIKGGFDSLDDLNLMVSRVSIKPGKDIQDFNKWKLEDGTKDGLVQLINGQEKTIHYMYNDDTSQLGIAVGEEELQNIRYTSSGWIEIKKDEYFRIKESIERHVSRLKNLISELNTNVIR